jgi:hypothetical protein
LVLKPWRERKRISSVYSTLVADIIPSVPQTTFVLPTY